MRPGTYRILQVSLDEFGAQRQHGLARFIVNNGHLHYLEDTGDHMASILAPGQVTAKTMRRLAALERNPYYRVIHEDDLNAGVHPELVPALDTGNPDPEAVFDVTYDGQKHVLEVYPGVSILDGRPLSENETKALMLEIGAGKKLLEPRG